MSEKSEADVNPGGRSPAQASPNVAGVAPAESRRTAFPRGSLWIWALAAGLLAGLASWAWGERTYNTYKPVFVQPPNWGAMNGYERADYRSADEIRQKPSLGLKNSMLVFGGLGVLLGALLGLTGGVARGSIPRGLTAAVIGAVAGLLASLCAAAAAVPIFYRFVAPDMGLIPPAATHLALFAASGAAAGLAFGIGVGPGGRSLLVRALAGGLMGGLLAALTYEIVSAIVFPDMRVYDPIPKEAAERVPRLVMHLSAGVFIAALTVASILQPSGKRAVNPHSASLS